VVEVAGWSLNEVAGVDDTAPACSVESGDYESVGITGRTVMWGLRSCSLLRESGDYGAGFRIQG